MASPETLELILIDVQNLRRLAAAEPIDLDGIQVLDGALPPANVAARALAQFEQGTPAQWCAPFLIVAGNEVVGTCRFRAAPEDGRVEIGYEVAGSQRGRGIATRAVMRLLEIAASSGSVREVVAHIRPDNVASSKVVARLGFSKNDALVELEGTPVALWSLRIAH